MELNAIGEMVLVGPCLIPRAMLFISALSEGFPNVYSFFQGMPIVIGTFSIVLIVE